MSKLKESFLTDITRGDYLPNGVGVPISFLRDCLNDDDTESLQPKDWQLPKFDESYGTCGAKNWLLKSWVEKNLPEQFGKTAETLPEGSEVDCLKIVENIPELKECLEYADYLREFFQRQLDDIHDRLSSEKNESLALAKEAGELIKDFNELRQTTRFDPEKDPEYQKQKEAAEAAAELSNDRRLS
ncbi:MAG: hypothetical protein HY569_02575 [Candidatus Magasanikbacteria bacterium]|nr:hypothetical protein [Candidatus Magasanikbacteria bacterium]